MAEMINLSADKAWSEILEKVKARIPLQSFNTWLKSTTGVSVDGEIFRVCAPNKFAANWITDKFLGLIQEAMVVTLGTPRQIEFICQPEREAGMLDAPPAPVFNMEQPKPPAAKRLLQDSQLSHRYLFENFVVGDSNQFAHAAAMAVAKAPMQTKYNPLYIYGGVGLGKTHLAQAVGNYVRMHFANLKILYVTSERFTNDFIDAIAHQKTSDFAKLYRGVDLLLLDDIQFLTGKEATQEQFFHTFNALHQAGKQIVLTSDRSPREIKGLEDRLLSRFQSGLVADIQPPDLETRIAILQHIVESEKQSVSFDVLTYIARNITRNIRELEGSIVRLLAYGSVTGHELNLSFTQEVLRETLGSSGTINIELITKAVCAHFKIQPEQLKSKRKTADLARARQVAMFLCRKHTQSSLKSIGDEFGGRDHSTVIHSISVVESEIKFDLNLRHSIEAIEAVLKA
jgi:chromosomal replication initiator protein